MQDRLDRLGHDEALIQRMGTRNFLIRTRVLEEASGDQESERERILKDLEEYLGLERDKVQFDSVSPIVAGETVRTAFYAVLVASLGILLYIWYAFRRVPKAYRYGISAIFALVHDVLFVLGVFSILGRFLNMEVNSMFIVGVLIVAGYSVNDTIVVFDRIRENLLRFPDRPLTATVNQSIMDTVGRSLNTSFTTLFVLLALLLMGGPSIRELLLVVAVGAIIGTYSSIFRGQPVPGHLGAGRDWPGAAAQASEDGDGLYLIPRYSGATTSLSRRGGGAERGRKTGGGLRQERPSNSVMATSASSMKRSTSMREISTSGS